VSAVQANSKRREAAKKTKDSLDPANVRLWGVVLDKRAVPIPKALYRTIQALSDGPALRHRRCQAKPG
jgi:Mrp family chromosome partitioning ATPase